MAFKILLLGERSYFSQLFIDRSEDLPWRVRWGEAVIEACQTPETAETFFEKEHVSVVLDLDSAYRAQDHALTKAVAQTINLCAKRNLPYIHLSSYAALGETDSENPVEENTIDTFEKVQPRLAQQELDASEVRQHVILRCSWVLDGGAHSLLTRFVPFLLRQEALAVSDHHFGSPVSSKFVVDVVVAIIQQILTGAENWGVFHIHSADQCSEAEFSDHLVRQLRKETEKDLEFPQVAALDDNRRYLHGNAQLAGRRLTDNFGIQLPTWRRGFGRLLRDWIEREQKGEL